LPLPLAPLVIVIQDAPLTAVHTQPGGVVTAVLPDAPAAGMVCDVEDSENVHGAL
jgi:hypothetical protein